MYLKFSPKLIMFQIQTWKKCQKHFIISSFSYNNYIFVSSKNFTQGSRKKCRYDVLWKIFKYHGGALNYFGELTPPLAQIIAYDQRTPHLDLVTIRYTNDKPFSPTIYFLFVCHEIPTHVRVFVSATPLCLPRMRRWAEVVQKFRVQTTVYWSKCRF